MSHFPYFAHKGCGNAKAGKFAAVRSLSRNTTIDCLKTSALRADRFPLLLSMWVVGSRGPYAARTIMCEPLASLVHGREAPHLRISSSMVGFTRVGMSLAACAERNRNSVITSRPLHTMPTVGKTPRCSRLSPSAEEPMVSKRTNEKTPSKPQEGC